MTTERIAAGVYDVDGELHFDIPEMLRADGVADTQENCDLLSEVIVRRAREQWPDLPIEVHQ